MNKVQIVEPWHPDIMSKEFVANLFSGRSKYEAKRYVEKNPCDVRGILASFVAGDWVHYKSKPKTHGVILETYLTERWVNIEGSSMLRGRPYQYELTCLVKWVPKSRPKNALPETSVVQAASLRSLTTQIKTLESKLKTYTTNGEKLLKYYEEHTKQGNYATTSIEG